MNAKWEQAEINYHKQLESTEIMTSLAASNWNESDYFQVAALRYEVVKLLCECRITQPHSLREDS